MGTPPRADPQAKAKSSKIHGSSEQCGLYHVGTGSRGGLKQWPGATFPGRTSMIFPETQGSPRMEQKDSVPGTLLPRALLSASDCSPAGPPQPQVVF